MLAGYLNEEHLNSILMAFKSSFKDTHDIRQWERWECPNQIAHFSICEAFCIVVWLLLANMNANA